MKPGSDKHQPSSEERFETLNDCPHCGTEGSLTYGLKDMDLNDDGTESTSVEGLICSTCDEIFMSLDESARLLNIKAKFEGDTTYFGVHDGDIKETRLQ